MTRPQPDFFAFDGLLTFERYKLPQRRQKRNRSEIVCKICACDFFFVPLHPKQKTQTEMDKKKFKHTSPEAAERERRHQFGQPEGNRRGDPSAAGSQRAFYRWCECEATEAELREYVKNKDNPSSRRKFISALLKCDTVQDFFDLTNQTHGQPKQVIEQTNLPEVVVVLE